jgi:predicted nucleic acid-binding protein
MKYLLDTYAWIEFFKASAKGERVAKLLENKKNKIVVCDVVFAEIFGWAIREKHIPGRLIAFIKQHSHIYELYTNIWLEGAAWKERMRLRKKDFGLADALLLSVQSATNATIVTGDPHFKGMKKVIML